MTDSQPPASSPKAPARNGFKLALAVFAVVVLALIWWRWQMRDAEPLFATKPSQPIPASFEQRLLASEQTLIRLEQERRQLQQRLNEAGNRNNLLRDEVLGIGERAALIEDSVRALNQGSRNAQADLRINEAELLLLIARERWQLSGDLAGTLQATELAALAVNGLKDPRWLNLRQALTQELAAFRAIESDPRGIARSELDALEAMLPQLPPAYAGEQAAPGERGFKRLLNALIRIQPSGQQTLISPAERQAAQTALALEMANARFALQLRQSHEFKRSAQRIDYWLGRLYSNTPELKQRRERLLAIANEPLSIAMPLAGSSLMELQRLKNNGAP